MSALGVVAIVAGCIAFFVVLWRRDAVAPARARISEPRYPRRHAAPARCAAGMHGLAAVTFVTSDGSFDAWIPAAVWDARPRRD